MKAVIFDMFETLISHYTCPEYFSVEMARDAGMPAEKFQVLWHSLEHDRTVGKITFDNTIERILKENDCYSPEVLKKIVEKRIQTKWNCFDTMNSEIIPMLKALKENGYKVALISNCFSEEAKVIKESPLMPYFDVCCLSYELGLAKPDPAIYKECLKRLELSPTDCFYVGDGGSHELEGAESCGLTAGQALWYRGDHFLSCEIKYHYIQLETPSDVLKYVQNH